VIADDSGTPINKRCRPRFAPEGYGAGAAASAPRGAGTLAREISNGGCDGFEAGSTPALFDPAAASGIAIALVTATAPRARNVFRRFVSVIGHHLLSRRMYERKMPAPGKATMKNRLRGAKNPRRLRRGRTPVFLREAEDEQRAAAFRVAGLDYAPVGSDDLLDNCEAEARPGNAARVRSSIEPVKYVWKIRGRDPWPVVANGDLTGLHVYIDGSLSGAPLGSVLENVTYGTAQRLLLAMKCPWLDSKLESRFRGAPLGVDDLLGNERCHVDLGRRRRLDSPRKVKKSLDELLELAKLSDRRCGY
jgi:hypothetical protein